MHTVPLRTLVQLLTDHGSLRSSAMSGEVPEQHCQVPTLLHVSQHLKGDGTNYMTWRMHVRAILGAYGLTKEINGTTRQRPNWGSGSPVPPDDLAKAIILINIQSYDVFRGGSVPFTRASFERATARQLWSHLERQFSESELQWY